MTVSLPKNVKAHIAQQFAYEQVTQATLAKRFKTSRRTIGRVLKEYGIEPVTPEMIAQARKVLGILKEYGTRVDELHSVLTFYRQQGGFSSSPFRRRSAVVPALLRPFSSVGKHG